jgi:AICAR transformylase/IMP cyclohydrolase PurH
MRLSEALSVPARELTDGERSEWMAGLSDVAFASDDFLPFRDYVDHAGRHRVAYIAEPGVSIRSAEPLDACREH